VRPRSEPEECVLLQQPRVFALRPSSTAPFPCPLISPDAGTVTPARKGPCARFARARAKPLRPLVDPVPAAWASQLEQGKEHEMTKNKPETTLRDGTLSATIWRNDGKNGSAFYSVQLNRRYQDQQGNWQDSDRFSGAELLRIARLATQAYETIDGLRQRDREEAANTGSSS
jgi:hypothetical protein